MKDISTDKVIDSTLVTSDVTTNDASTSKHGFLKKLSGNSTEYMNGTGAWSIPSGYGTFASMPSAGRAGQLYTPTDGYSQWIDDGTIWRPLTEGVVGTAPPAAASWTKQDYNSASGTLTDSMGAIIVKNTAHDTTDRPTIAYKAVPSTPYVVTAHLLCDIQATNYAMYGLALRDGTGAMIFFSQMWNSGMALGWTNPVDVTNTSGVVTADLNGAGGMASGIPHYWFRIADDGTTRSYWISVNGRSWARIFTHAHTANITPTGIGIMSNARGNAFDMDCVCVSWVEA